MKISSNFKDYYDSQRAMDRDEEPHYLRFSREETTTSSELGDRTFPYIQQYRCTVGCIAFCGRVYPFVSIGKGKDKKTSYTLSSAIAMVKSWESSATDSSGNPAQSLGDARKYILDYLQSEHRYFGQSQYIPIYWNTWHLPRSPIDGAFVVDDKIFRHHQAPVLLMEKNQYEPHRLVINPRLSEYDFIKVMDPTTAYQELSMFVGNNLANISMVDPRPITDSERASTKGFDKQSFRNQKNRKASDRSEW